LRFPLREALRPLELPRLLSLGARVSESLSTRLDSVRAPDRLCVDDERLDPDDRLRELALERLFDDEERLLDFDEFDEERFEPPERLLLLLLLDREDFWGILPSLQLVVILWSALTRAARFESSISARSSNPHFCG